MSEPLQRLSSRERRALRRRSMPDWIEPMTATLVDRSFSDTGWLFEPKLDGVRCLAFRDGERVRLLTRNGKTRHRTYPELVDALSEQPLERFVVDGEVVAFAGGLSSFARLQDRDGIDDPEAARASGIKVYLYVFDLPWAAGYDLRGLALRTRKRLLRDMLSFGGDAIRYGTHRNRHGDDYFRKACSRGWEGIMAKRADAAYAGRRSRYWLKIKCDRRQEFVIGGFTDPQGQRTGFGALLVGYYENDRLRYAGRVGTGFDEAMLADLHAELSDRRRASRAFHDRDIDTRGVHWVRPDLVGEVAFTEWTQDGRLRHPRFLGLRRDKPARDVVLERPRPQVRP